MLQEGFLAFLGITVQWQGEELTSWGGLVSYGRLALGSAGEGWWMLLAPSIAMSAVLVALNVLGDGLRDALDPHLKGRE